MQAPGSSQEAILPARAVADAPFSALAARLDDLGHRERKLRGGFASGRKVKVRDVCQFLAAPKNRGFQFLIPTLTWYISKKKRYDTGKTASERFSCHILQH